MKRPTRQIVPPPVYLKTMPPAWWVGKTREELVAIATQRAREMSATPEGRSLGALRFGKD